MSSHVYHEIFLHFNWHTNIDVELLVALAQSVLAICPISLTILVSHSTFTAWILRGFSKAFGT